MTPGRQLLGRLLASSIALALVAIAVAACKGEVEPDGGGANAGAGAGVGAGAGAGASAGAGGRAGGGTGAGAGAGAGGRAGGGAGGGDASVPQGGTGGGGGQAGAAIDDAGTDAQADSGVAESPCPSAGGFGDPLPPAGRTAVLIQGGFDFLEGPVWHHDQGVLFFSDMHMDGNPVPPATIMRFTPPSTFEPFVDQGVNGSNGLALTLEGDLLACTHDLQTLSIYDATSAVRETLELTYMGDHFNSPNDLTVRSDGTIYFTDPDWQLGGRTSETGMTGVYRLAPGGEPQLVDGELDKPNGIALSPDEQTLYVTSAGADLMAYPIAADGSTGSGTVLASPGGSDGLAVDCAGNLYVTAGSVRVFDPDGSELGAITVAEQPANVAFGGSERRTLYVTARTSLYAIELNVPGYPY